VSTIEATIVSTIEGGTLEASLVVVILNVVMMTATTMMVISMISTTENKIIDLIVANLLLLYKNKNEPLVEVDI
jgi:hypothetical protein